MNTQPIQSPQHASHEQSAPHQLANEMTTDDSVQSTDRRPDTRRPGVDDHGEPSMRVEKSIGRSMALIALGAVVIGLVVSALLLQQMKLLIVGAVFIIPFLLLVSAPVWLASVTKQSQDETLREQRE